MSDFYIVPLCTETIGVLYRDEHLLLIEKPQPLLSIPGRNPLNADCVITRIREDYPSASVVHRLDMDTSGIMIVPLDKATHSHIGQQFERREVAKQYQAVVFGVMLEDTGEIDMPIAADWPNRPRQKICEEKGRASLTRYEVLERDPANNRSRVLLLPETGRSHQLRIHLREIGHPILGCDLYAHPEALAMSPRLLLHASYIGFTHPITGVWLEQHSQAPF